MKKILYTLFVLFLLNSCSTGDTGGLFTPLILSVSEYTFGVEGGSITITVEPKDALWNMSVGRVCCCGSAEFPGHFYYGEWDEWDFSEFTECSLYEGLVVGIKTDWFEITRDPLYKIRIDVQPNTSGRERQVYLALRESVFFGGGVIMTQSAE